MPSVRAAQSEAFVPDGAEVIVKVSRDTRSVLSRGGRGGAPLIPMPKKKYPYQVVLDDRAEKKREACRLVETCREQLELAEAESERLRLAADECRRLRMAAQRELTELSSGTVKGYQIVEHLDYVAELKHREAESKARVAEQQVVVARAASVLERAMTMLVEAARDEQASEKHLEDWLRERRREEERVEQKRLDEIGSIFHGRRSPG
jgi:uncharacterized NAD(P)/FAD-binding protein YdhS